MTIAEVSRQFDITPDTLRYYERIGLIPPVPRTKSGIEYVALFQQGDSTIGARKALLLEQRDQLEERIATMQQTLARLNHKIENYGNCLAKEPELRGKAKD